MTRRSTRSLLKKKAIARHTYRIGKVKLAEVVVERAHRLARERHGFEWHQFIRKPESTIAGGTVVPPGRWFPQWLLYYDEAAAALLKEAGIDVGDSEESDDGG